jgi:hypothetical protein
MRKEDKTGEDQDYADGVIVDIDETQFEKQFVIILGNGTLIWASKNELKLGCSEVNVFKKWYFFFGNNAILVAFVGGITKYPKPMQKTKAGTCIFGNLNKRKRFF